MSNEHLTVEHLHLAQWQDRLQDAIDQALSPTETVQLHAHLSSCTICTREHRRLLAVDARLRSEFAATATPSANFNQRLFANIAALEQDQRAAARQREQQEYATRLAHLRGGWRELLRFHLGNIIGGVVTVGAVSVAIVSAWPAMAPTLAKGLTGTQAIAWLPQGLVTTVLASLGIAAAAIWIARRVDRHPG